MYPNVALRGSGVTTHEETTKTKVSAEAIEFFCVGARWLQEAR